MNIIKRHGSVLRQFYIEIFFYIIIFVNNKTIEYNSARTWRLFSTSLKR